MNLRPNLLALPLVAALAAVVPARAQDASCTPEHAAMGHCTLPAGNAPAPGSTAVAEPPAAACPPEHAAMGHCTPAETAHAGHASHGAVAAPAADASCPAEHAAMGHCIPAVAPPLDPACPPEHAAMGHCTPRQAGLQAPREPIPVLTDADRAAAFPPLRHDHMSHGSAIHSLVLFNRLEAWDADPGTGQAWEGSAWIGGDIDRLWLRSEGERTGGRTASADLEVLYGRAVATWWDVVAGIKHDFRPARSQTHAAIGVQGLAPYMFEISATAYLSESGRLSASVEAEYEILLTNRLILQPLLELHLGGRDDPERQVGAGLEKAEFGLRLRYEIRREFAPYVGIVHERSFGDSADYHRQQGDSARDTRVVAGVRFWF